MVLFLLVSGRGLDVFVLFKRLILTCCTALRVDRPVRETIDLCLSVPLGTYHVLLLST